MTRTMFHDATEWYPVLELVAERKQAYGDRTAEFTEAEIQRAAAARTEFLDVQKLLYERFGLIGSL